MIRWLLSAALAWACMAWTGAVCGGKGRVGQVLCEMIWQIMLHVGQGRLPWSRPVPFLKRDSACNVDCIDAMTF